MPVFSIVIPLYNKANYFENTLKSVLEQTFTAFEIVIVDDCGSDNSYDVAKRFVSDKIRIIRHDRNHGLSAARNTGIKNANSNYVAFVDADDLWKPDYLQELHQLVSDFSDAKLFATAYEEIYPGNIVA